MKADKTNVMRVLESKKIAYKPHEYEADPTLTGADIAGILKEDTAKVFKTLVTVGNTGKNYVFVVPVTSELDLKKAAKAAGEKSIEMIKQKDLLPLTGYVHGGCSPIGMKKLFPTFMHLTAETFDTVFVSGGRVGFQVELSPKDLKELTRLNYSDIITE